MFSFYRKTSPAAIAAPPSKGEFCVAVRQYLFEQALNSCPLKSQISGDYKAIK